MKFYWQIYHKQKLKPVLCNELFCRQSPSYLQDLQLHVLFLYQLKAELRFLSLGFAVGFNEIVRDFPNSG